MKKGLIITDVPFWKKGAGHKTRISQLISYLSKYVHLNIAYVGLHSQDDDWMIKALTNVNIIFLEKQIVLKPKQYGERLKNIIGNQKIDFCIIEYLHNSYFLSYLPPNIITFLDTHDIISDRTKEFQKYNYKSLYSEIDEKIEISIFEMFNYVMLICEPDFDLVNKFIPENKLLIVPHSPELKRNLARSLVTRIGFVGSEYLPNVDALDLFIKEYWPNILEKHNIKLNIYGNVANFFKHLPSDLQVNLIGFVSIYGEIDIAINPVRFGAGIKIKNIEAMANSIPLVTTTHGSRGLEDCINSGFLLADDKEKFIESLIKLIQDFELRKKIGEKAYSFIHETYLPEKCYNGILKIVYEK